MTLILYGHPFSSYTWKSLIALYENDTPFDFRTLGPDQPENEAELARRWPLGKFPILIDGERFVAESSVIIDYLALHHRGLIALIPTEGDAEIEVRMLDRFFDNYVMTPMQKVVGDAIRPEAARDPLGVSDARGMLDTAYEILDRWMASREWAAAGMFSLADCAAAPALFYADWVHPIPDALGHARAYRARLLDRPSVARCVDDARPYRELFPLGAPDRD
jgi:glutathione S-transferase